MGDEAEKEREGERERERERKRNAFKSERIFLEMRGGQEHGSPMVVGEDDALAEWCT